MANPVDWVLVPIKCALVWAFVPRQSHVDGISANMNNRVQNSPVGALTTAAAGLGASFAVGSASCEGLPFHLEGPGWSFNERLFSSCEEPLAGAAATVKAVLSFVILFGGALAVLRYFSSFWNYTRFGESTADSGVKFK